MKQLAKALRVRHTKRYWDGTHRSLPPDQTIGRLTPLINQFGITRVANITGLDWLGIPVVMVCRPNSRSLSVSQGKGLTLDAAKASGLMESIELFYAEHIKLPLKASSFHEMSQHVNVVNVEELPYLNRLSYHAHRELLWIEGYDLLNNEAIWVPYECVSMNTSNINQLGQGSFLQSSNGLASGNDLLEAIVHAICEVIERDATTLWRYRTPRVKRASNLDLSSCDDLNCRKLIARCLESGLQLLVWETTSDIGLPSFLCLLHEGHNNRSRLPYAAEGMGCHVSGTVALLRAITEAAQCRLTLISGSRDDVFRGYYQQSHLGSGYLSDYCALQAPKGRQRSFKTIRSIGTQTFNDDLGLILNGLQDARIKQVIIIPLTEAESPFQVVKIVIPGLEGYDAHPNYAPGLRAIQLRAHRV